MYESYSRQALPERQYREYLGSALCVFNSNNSYIIENILRNDQSGKLFWYDLIDKRSSKHKKVVKETITKQFGPAVEQLFSNIIDKRNRIIHSFQITDKDNKQRLATKEQNSGKQFVITEEYLLEFIADNEKLSVLLDSIRGY